MKIITLLPIVLLFLVVIVSAQYDDLGSSDNDFESGDNIFSSSLQASFSSISLSSPEYAPLVGDLDGQGDKDIVVKDGTTIKVFDFNNSIFARDSLTLNYSTGSNIVLYDIDTDGRDEILIADQFTTTNEFLWILNYSISEGIQIQNILDWSIYTNDHTANGEVIIGCSSTRCMLQYTDTQTGNDISTATYGAITFDSTQILDAQEFLFNDATAADILCMPRIKLLDTGNADADAEEEFFMGYSANVIGASITFYGVSRIDVLANGSIQSEVNADLENGQNQISVSPTCTAPTHNAHLGITPLLVYQPAGVGSSELAFAIMKSASDFKMYRYDTNFNIIDDHPETSESEGVLISNVFAGQFFPETTSPAKSVCVMGYNGQTIGGDENVLEVLCNQPSGDSAIFAFDQLKFRMNIEDLDLQFNVTFGDYGETQMIAHSAAITDTSVFSCRINDGADCDTAPSRNVDEIVTPYGTFSLTRNEFTSSESSSNCGTSGICQLEPLFEHGRGSAVVVPVQYQDVGEEDLLVMTSSNLYYFDDVFVNQPPTVSSTTASNPCITDIWRINTSVQVNVIASDDEGDNVRARVIVYEGTDNEFDLNYSAFFPAGTNIPFSFIANKTGNNQILRIEVEDTENPGDIGFAEIPFSVAASGVEFGDTSCNIQIEEEPTVSATNTSTVLAGEDSVSTGINEAANVLNLSPFLFALLVMLFIAIGGIYGISQGVQASSAFAIVAIAEVFALILFTVTGAFPIGYTILIGVISVVIIGWWAGRFITGSNT